MSEEKSGKYPAALEQDGRAVQLRESGSGSVAALIDNALVNLSRDQARNLAAKAADAALHLEVKAREQRLDYVAGKKALEDHVDAFTMLEKQGTLTRQTLVSDIKTGAGNMHIESKSGATCFVATATYGGADHPNVRFLRQFRDDCLAHTPAGRSFIDWYWRTGPKLARWVNRSTALKRASRAALSVLVLAIKFHWNPANPTVTSQDTRESP